jgi:hypothetical protein
MLADSDAAGPLTPRVLSYAPARNDYTPSFKHSVSATEPLTYYILHDVRLVFHASTLY